MSLRLYRRWKERRRRALDRYSEMSDEQREAVDRYKHRSELGPPGAMLGTSSRGDITKRAAD